MYVSWSPFWWKTRWLHRSRSCSETWELSGVQKHHLSILPCSNCFPLGRTRLIHIARHIPLVLWWTTVSWMCKLWEFLCFCVQSFDSLTNCWRQKVLRWTQLGGFNTPSGNSQMSRSRNATSLAYQELLNEKIWKITQDMLQSYTTLTTWQFTNWRESYWMKAMAQALWAV